jgi:hypothetical protein
VLLGVRKAIGKSAMNVHQLFSHLHWVVANKQPPNALGARIARKFHLDSLSDKGLSDLEQFSDAELTRIWQDTFWNEELGSYEIAFTPQPSSYLLVPCYAQLFRGLGYFGATLYRADSQTLYTLSAKKEALEMNSFHPVSGVSATLELIGTADPVVEKFVTLTVVEEAVLMKLLISEKQIQRFSSLYQALPVEQRGLGGTSEKVRKAIKKM